MKTLRIGVASLAEMKARSLAIAGGTQKVGRSEPKLWLSSLDGLSKVLSPGNRRLLKLIADRQPESLAELSEWSGRAVSNLSRTLANMERYGLVHRVKDQAGRLRIKLRYDSVSVQIGIGAGRAAAAPRRAGERRRLTFKDAVGRGRHGIDASLRPGSRSAST